MTTCPKCGYTRQSTDAAPDYECPSCGVIYQKFLEAQAKKRQQAEEQAARDAGVAEAARKREDEARVAEEDKIKANLTSCRACKGVVSWGAKSCPHCGQRKPAGPKPVSRRTQVIVLLGLVAVIVALANAPRDGNATDDFSATAACQSVIKRGLKAPSSASFASGKDLVRRRPDGSVNVIGYVDAQNGFGATLRNEYECELVQNGGGFSVKHAGMNGEVLF
ncbi:hypothetical protein SAMN05421829_108143 [Aromatoleum tolulyticum]|uniref:Uncharacterized protein n=1 Tax=Aromatoleum tolulyticum TaxID=34027 RepID=A0A1N6X0C0_9RHOO|nr:hypothetical protein [Aromatoleum tolulyticum]SIQ95792.1 hypothetical protein SAMN05421829_108143 [Aromatoleum tolulyticum]